MPSFGAEYLASTAIQKYKDLRYTTIILHVLYGCETWSLALREKRRLRVFENRVLRRIFGPKRDDVTLEWKNYKMRSLISCPAHHILFE